MLSRFRRVQGDKGFTLIELLIVISIILVILGVSVIALLPLWTAYQKNEGEPDNQVNNEELFP